MMDEQLNLGRSARDSSPVGCLGQTFPSDQARREHFLQLLAEKLKDPEFRKQEGFPQGTDEAILAMSDPPYYTACPNPWLADFVKHYGKPYDPNEPYQREPLAIDVSVGKTDPIYKAHSYHTGVCQCSWNMSHAASSSLCTWITVVSFSGFSQTLPTGCQFRVLPDQRAGC